MNNTLSLADYLNFFHSDPISSTTSYIILIHSTLTEISCNYGAPSIVVRRTINTSGMSGSQDQMPKV